MQFANLLIDTATGEVPKPQAPAAGGSRVEFLPMALPADPGAVLYLVWYQAQGPYWDQRLPWLVQFGNEKPLAFGTEAEARAAAARLNTIARPDASTPTPPTASDPPAR